MREFSLNSSISEEDFVILILNDFPDEYNIMLDELENYLKSPSPDMLTLEVIHEKLNHWCNNSE